MRFQPQIKRTKREWTGRRVAAAARAVRRERESVALFPELSRYATVEERIAEVDADGAAMVDRWRAHAAKSWRKARRLIAAMPELQRRGMLRYWQESHCPADPSYLLDAIHGLTTRGVSPWSRLRFMRQLWLTGQGRLPRAKLNETFE